MKSRVQTHVLFAVACLLVGGLMAVIAVYPTPETTNITLFGIGCMFVIAAFAFGGFGGEG